MSGRVHLRSERGVTLIEVLVGMLLLVVGLGAVMAAFPASGRQVLTGQREEQAAAIAEREIEALRGRPYANVALTTPPSNSPTNGLNADDADQNNPRNPNFYVNGPNLRIKRDFHNQNSGTLAESPAAGEPLVVAAGGVAPTATVAADGIDYTVYRYVTTRQELCPPTLGNEALQAVTNSVTNLLGTLLGLVNSIVPANINVLCSGTGEKRLIVAVVPARAGNRAGVTRPVYMSTIVANPTLGLTGLSG
jgi:type II secretory pathway pseudopilin PulG